jgi:ABC-2 type transport system ATP-binding protein
MNKVSFSITKGEIFGFLGPNGAGKTTMIRMLIGLLTLDVGDIYIR